MKRYIKSNAELIEYADYDAELGKLIDISDNGQYALYMLVGQRTKQNIYTLVKELDDSKYRWVVDMQIIPVTYQITVDVIEVNPTAPLDESIIYLRDSLSEVYNFKKIIENIFKSNK